MDKIENQEIIKKYVEGTLSNVEKQAFEQVLATDVALQKEVETYRAFHLITRNRDLMLASQTINAVIGKTVLKPDFEAYQSYLKPPSVKFWKKQWFWALSTLVVIVLASIGVYQGKNKAEQARNAAIVAQFEPFENVIGLSPDDTSPFAQAMRLYDSGDFIGTKTILTTYVPRTSDPIPQFYLGISQLMTNENEAAINTLRSVLQNPDTFMQEPARFNLALALVKVGKRQEATEILRGFMAHPIYGKKAENVLNELNKN